MRAEQADKPAPKLQCDHSPTERDLITKSIICYIPDIVLGQVIAPMLTAEEKYRRLATDTRAQAGSDPDLYYKRMALQHAEHYDKLADRAKRAVERRRSLKRKTG